MCKVRSSNGKRPVIALDIDGTLGNYHAHFITFAEAWTGRALPDPLDINPGIPLHKHLGLGKATYRACKLAYRQGGMKRSMPVYPHAAELTKNLRRAGAEVWICTTRPYLRLDNIDPDTRHWLRRHGIQYDGVLFGENKYRELVKRVDRKRVVAVLDDLMAMVGQAQGLGLPAYLRDQPYNQYVSNTYRIHDLKEAEVFFWNLIQQWKANQ